MQVHTFFSIQQGGYAKVMCSGKIQLWYSLGHFLLSVVEEIQSMVSSAHVGAMF